MKYSLKNIVSLYIKQYIQFVKEKNLDKVSKDDLYELFTYGVRTIYEIPYFNTNFYVDRYGEECMKYLKKAKGIPKKSKRLSITDKFEIVSMCNSYFLAVGLVSEDKEKVAKRGVVVDGNKESL